METVRVVTRPLLINRNQPMRKSTINDNYCVNCVASKNCIRVTGKVDSLNVVPEIAGQKDCICDQQERETVNFLPVNSCSFCKRASAKERCKFPHWSSTRNKKLERCFLCRSLEFCKKCHTSSKHCH